MNDQGHRHSGSERPAADQARDARVIVPSPVEVVSVEVVAQGGASESPDRRPRHAGHHECHIIHRLRLDGIGTQGFWSGEGYLDPVGRWWAPEPVTAGNRRPERLLDGCGRLFLPPVPGRRKAKRPKAFRPTAEFALEHLARLRCYYAVGTAGFEPATPATPLQCATGLRHVPLFPAPNIAPAAAPYNRGPRQGPARGPQARRALFRRQGRSRSRKLFRVSRSYPSRKAVTRKP